MVTWAAHITISITVADHGNEELCGETRGLTDDVAGENKSWMTAREKCVQDRARTLIEMIHGAVRDSAWGESSRPLRFVSAPTTSAPCITRSTRN